MAAHDVLKMGWNGKGGGCFTLSPREILALRLKEGREKMISILREGPGHGKKGGRKFKGKAPPQHLPGKGFRGILDELRRGEGGNEGGL